MQNPLRPAAGHSLFSTDGITLWRRTTYICRAVRPLNGRTAIKVAGGGGGFNSGAKDKIPAPKGSRCVRCDIADNATYPKLMPDA